MPTVANQSGRPREPSATNEWITTGEAARRLGVRSRNIVMRWAQAGKLGSRRIGHRTQIYAPSVERLLAQADPEVTRWQQLERWLDPIDAWGQDLPPEAWRRVLADRPGRLPWQSRDSS